MSITLVTVLFDFSKRQDRVNRTIDQYLQFGKSVLDIPQNMIIFCDPELVQHMKDARSKILAKTQVITMLFEETPAYPWITKARECKLPTNKPMRYEAGNYLVLGWSKLLLLKQVAQENPFKSTHVGFIDFGITHCIPTESISLPGIFDTTDDKVHLHVMRQFDAQKINAPDYYNYTHGLIAAGYIAGSTESVVQFVDEFELEVLQRLAIGSISIDEDIIAVIAGRNMNTYSYSYGDYSEIFSNYNEVRSNLSHISWMMKDARERSAWDFICVIGASVVASHKQGLLEYNPIDLESVLLEYFIAAYWKERPMQNLAREISLLYYQLVEDDVLFKQAYKTHADLVRSNFGFLRQGQSSLDEIAICMGTDKSSRAHNYTAAYEQILSSLRSSPIKLLEIGVFKGESLRMWSKYFLVGQIVGLDIYPGCVQYATDKIKIVIGNQADVDFLRQIGEEYGPFDIVIDDGSHVPYDVIISFKTLFPYVVPGGYYVIEDLCCSFLPSVYGPSAGLHNPRSSVEFLKSLQDVIHYDPRHGGTVGDEITSAIDAIHTFHMISFLHKKG
jgi:demethylmacrocin O-methyltransferase